MTEQVLAVQRMQDYIEKHKTEEISLSDLARASLFSPWYAFRLFRNVLGLTPAEYIRKYRLTQAAKQLRGVELTMYIVYCAVSLLTLSAAALLWGVRLHGSLLAFLGSWVLTMLSTLSVGMLVGGVAKDAKQASVIASILYFPMLVFSGTTLPIEVMPKAMQKIVSIFPLTQGLTMMKNTFLGISAGSVLLPIGVMVGVAALCTILAVRFFRWE